MNNVRLTSSRMAIFVLLIALASSVQGAARTVVIAGSATVLAQKVGIVCGATAAAYAAVQGVRYVQGLHARIAALENKVRSVTLQREALKEIDLMSLAHVVNEQGAKITTFEINATTTLQSIVDWGRSVGSHIKYEAKMRVDTPASFTIGEIVLKEDDTRTLKELMKDQCDTLIIMRKTASPLATVDLMEEKLMADARAHEQRAARSLSSEMVAEASIGYLSAEQRALSSARRKASRDQLLLAHSRASESSRAESTWYPNLFNTLFNRTK